jgi:hypothetical protein
MHFSHGTTALRLPKTSFAISTRESQLEFDFGNSHIRRVLITAMERLHGARLHELLYELNPTVVLDLRNTIRFDLPGTNRDLFLGRISELRSCYVRAPMEWKAGPTSAQDGNDRYPLPDRVNEQVLDRREGNIMLLVNRSSHAAHISSMLDRTRAANRFYDFSVDQAL